MKMLIWCIVLLASPFAHATNFQLLLDIGGENELIEVQEFIYDLDTNTILISSETETICAESSNRSNHSVLTLQLDYNDLIAVDSLTYDLVSSIIHIITENVVVCENDRIFRSRFKE